MAHTLVKQHIPLHDQNNLFALMPENVKERWQTIAKPVTLKRDEILLESGKLMEYVYFPIDAIATLLFVTSNGSTTEVAVVGNDGIIGALSLLSSDDTQTKAYVVREGLAYRVPSRFVRSELHSNDSVLSTFLRYIQSIVTQASITAICNRHHSIEQQYCKFLLLTLDRLPCSNLILTQEVAAVMLGVRRESITDAALKLQRLGIITYRRGYVTVLNRTKLEQLSCECYRLLARKANNQLCVPMLSIPAAIAHSAMPK